MTDDGRFQAGAAAAGIARSVAGREWITGWALGRMDIKSCSL